MKNKKKQIISLLFAFYFLSALLYIEYKQEGTRKAIAPDLDNLVDVHLQGWKPVESVVTNPAWKSSAELEYDKISAQSYENENGERVTIVMTWSRNGIQRAGHIQQLCYSAHGYDIRNVRDVALNVSKKLYHVTAFSATKITGEHEDVIYWRKTDGKLMNNITDVDYGDYRLQHRILKMKELLGSVFGKTPDNIMVRISSIGNTDENKKQTHLIFAEKYIENLTQDKKNLIMVN